MTTDPAATPINLSGLATQDRSAQGIAQALGRLITVNELEPGQRLPTVRAAAKQLNVSPTTVSEAWRILQRHGSITTDGRRGTFVRATRTDVAPGRYWQVPVEPGTFALDLSTGTPDPSLLPDLRPVFARTQLDLPVNSYLEDAVLPSLAEFLHADWPFVVDVLTIVDGAQDALGRMVQAVVGFGDTVVVNDPAFPPLLDMLENAGANVIGVGLDDEGMIVGELAAALEHQPCALFYQPRAHNPTGCVTSKGRSKQLAKLLAGTGVIIVEDDHSALVSGTELASLGEHIPDQTVYIRSYSKSHGPDLRLAAVGGAREPLVQLIRRRRLGPSWTSRLLQQLLLDMLTNEDAVAHVESAQATYHERRRRIVDGLDSRGVPVGGQSGLNLWVPVHDEQIALVSLAANGIGAAPGTPFMVETTSPHLRLSIGSVGDEVDSLCDQIAAAAKAGSS